MKFFEALLISTAMVLIAASQVRADCTPGAIWKEDCNTCFCTQNREVSCTRMACATRYKRDMSPECTPGTTWKEDCNSCFCTSKGFKGCTLMACPPRTYGRRQRSHDCVPGTVWKDDCNTCVCHAGGRASCTEIACLKDPRYQ